MNYVGKLWTNVREFYKDINSATLTGAIDIVVIEQPDGSLMCSPFHVRFGKMGVLRSKEKIVDIAVNGKSVDLHMKLGDSGEAFFVEQNAFSQEETPEYLSTSPILRDSVMAAGIQQLKESIQGDDSMTFPESQGAVVKRAMLMHSSDSSSSSVSSNREMVPVDNCPAVAGLHDKQIAMKDNGMVPSTDTQCRSLDFLVKEPEVNVSKEIKGLRLHHSKHKKYRKRRGGSRKGNEALDGMAKEEIKEDVTSTAGNAGDAMFEMELTEYDEAQLKETSLNVPRALSMSHIECSSDWQPSSSSAFHPFSDGDITPIVSPVGSRPPSPKSDTELDNQQHSKAANTSLSEEDNVRWEWGELPRASIESPTCSNKTPKQKSDGGLLNFMKKTKKLRHQPNQEGIYLEDLILENEMDPELAALYLSHPRSEREHLDDDVESGTGVSLPQSPVNTEKETSLHCQPLTEHIELSLCGGLRDCEEQPEGFAEHLVTFDNLCHQPNLTNDGRLVIHIGERYYNWQVTGPQLLSYFAFKMPLPENILNQMVQEHICSKKTRRGWGGWWRGSEGPTDQKEPMASGVQGSGKLCEKEALTGEKAAAEQPEVSSAAVSVMDGEARDNHDQTIPIEPMRATEVSSPAVADDAFYIKSLKLTSEQLVQLNLEEGENKITFSVTTQYQGTSRCDAYIYRWKWNDRIIISDIDGTITKSDVWGQILPMVGKDWSQAGIASLYSMISVNGYRFLYLSARAIGQSKITRDYLQGIRQGELCLPKGPLLLSPSSLISAFHREVIERKPEEFKIACLKDIGALFPDRKRPFYAGYGNKINDAVAYTAVGIPYNRIFTVNHKGEIRMEISQTFQSSYTKLGDIVDHFFPPLMEKQTRLQISEKIPIGNFPEPDEYSTFTYWRDPVAEVDIKIDEL